MSGASDSTPPRKGPIRSQAEKATHRRLLADMTYELIPLKNVHDQDRKSVV